jgi:DNA-binding protein HU-beta
MNKTQLIEKIGAEIGDKKAAAVAVDALVDAITTTVADGEKVTIPGFGSFSRALRPARDARNPSTGETVHVPATFVPRWKVGAGFRAAVRARHGV